MDQFGILDVLMVTAAIVLSRRIYYAAHPPPADADEQRPKALAIAGTVSPERSAPAAVATESTPLDEMLRRIGRSGAFADAASFLEGAKLAYEMIVKAFAYGNIEEHAHLLTDDVREAFANAIADRKAKGETESLTFIGLRAAEIVDAGLEGGRAWIEVRFVAEVVSVTYDADGRVIGGAPGRVVDIAELWTFERELRAAGPDWLLAATDADA